EVPASDCRQSFRTKQQSDGGTRTGAIVHGGVIARATDNVHYVALDARFDSHISYFGSATGNRIRIGKRMNLHLIKAARIETRVPARDDLMFLVRRRIRQKNLQQKTIKLRFR